MTKANIFYNENLDSYYSLYESITDLKVFSLHEQMILCSLFVNKRIPKSYYTHYNDSIAIENLFQKNYVKIVSKDTKGETVDYYTLGEINFPLAELICKFVEKGKDWPNPFLEGYPLNFDTGVYLLEHKKTGKTIVAEWRRNYDKMEYFYYVKEKGVEVEYCSFALLNYRFLGKVHMYHPYS